MGQHSAHDNQAVEKFRKHVQWIHNLVQKSYSHVLAPWKINQNVSVSTQEDAFGNALLRVICLQPHGTPGIMQVGISLLPGTMYDLRVEGCALPSQSESGFQACPFIDEIRQDKTSKLVVWNCSRALRAHAQAAHSDLPCSDLDFHRGNTQHNRFEGRLRFETGNQETVITTSRFRIGVLFSRARPGDTFFLKQICWRPISGQASLPLAGTLSASH
eukprot:CAMPEP_0202830606 /NCGR_PEP_ID=MMETSP1389-20130828/16283_1 /ASSEMBLY_ACC=CAM_ASM_000865 /TAXON_ID=302021 /ORGANISM="Rhodomonas sp., Strain CCMP768" /LENGTH=215 /DNA_ID=CAMNT_0049504261 /DNA_START=160 /DNA_END=804 /DNA_ORIENTATION=+